LDFRQFTDPLKNANGTRPGKNLRFDFVYDVILKKNSALSTDSSLASISSMVLAGGSCHSTQKYFSPHAFKLF
jgi:hypothetical protein